MVGLSKSRVMAGLQCAKRLWWTVHEPAAAELVPDAQRQAALARGHAVGAAACRHVPGGVAIDRGARGLAGAIADTRQAIRDGADVLYEAAFSAGGVFAAVDILERDGDGWNLVEVKTSCSVQQSHVRDAAVQRHVLESAGLKVRRAEVMVLNRDCVYPDLSNLFVRHDVTERAEACREGLVAAVADLRTMLNGPLPVVEVGDHCTTPYACPFRERCWPDGPEHHISSLYGKRTARALEARGVERVHDVAEQEPLSAVQRRQVRAVCEDRIVVEPGLAAALARLPRPWGYLDFETIGPAIPRWPGCRPYDAVPAQFVVYAEDTAGEYEVREWLAPGAGDPRIECARRLVESCRGPEVLLAWFADFERRCIRALMDAVPRLAADLQDVYDRVTDLLPIVREHVYHPHFRGSFSLKAVLPALVPELSYNDLAIRGGEEASRVLESLVCAPHAAQPPERARLRAALGAYCRRDTWGLVRLHQRMRELVAEA